MSKFHIGKSGEPQKCTATKKGCPLGGEHFDSMEAAYISKNFAKQEQPETVQALERRAESRLMLAKYADTEQEATALRNEHSQLMREAAALRAAQKKTISDEPVHAPVEVAAASEPGTRAPVAVTPVDAYTEEEVYTLALEELAKHGLLKDGWTVSFGQRTRALGTCYHAKKQVEFSKLWFPIMSKEETRDVVTHEVAHALVGPGQEHGEQWQQQHRALGGNGLAAYDSDDPQVREGYKERFKKFYPNGVQFGTRGGVAKREVDPDVIQRLNEGNEPSAPRRTSPGTDTGPDPEFIEALRMMYLDKFGHLPEDDGVDAGALLAMFNKGELA